MDRNYLLLLLLMISMVQLIIMSHQHGEYRERDFSETLTIQFENITEVKMSDLEGNYRSTTEPEIINKLIQHFNDFHYKRLVNDQTAYMPLKTRMIYLYEIGRASCRERV